MWRPLIVLVVLTVNCLPARLASADITYTFTTISPAPSAGPVSGSFVVSDSAIRDSFINAAEIASYDFRLPLAAFPFIPATFAPPDTLTIASPFGGAILVDPLTGAFKMDASIGITHSATLERLGLTVFRDTVPPQFPSYGVGIGTFPFDQNAQGSGSWTVVIPEPSSVLFFGVAGIVFALVHYGRRRRDSALA